MAKKKTNRKKAAPGRAKAKKKPSTHPAPWRPSYGMTNSGLNTWMTCREQYSLKYLDGYREPGMHNPIEYGNFWHAAEEIHATYLIKNPGSSATSRGALGAVDVVLARQLESAAKKAKTREAKAQLAFAAEQVAAIFPVYCDYYKDQRLDWHAREQVFKEKMRIDGRVMFVTGKIDGLYYTRIRGKSYTGVFETKTKGRIDRSHIDSQITCDAQSLFYLNACAIMASRGELPFAPAQLTYNVVKRCQLKQTKNETRSVYLKRARENAEKRPTDWFYRPTREFSLREIEEYRRDILTPQLRAFFGWYNSVVDVGLGPADRVKSSLHFLNLPALVDGYKESAFLKALTTRVGRNALEKTDDIYPELYPDPWQPEHPEYSEDFNAQLFNSDFQPTNLFPEVPQWQE